MTASSSLGQWAPAPDMGTPRHFSCAAAVGDDRLLVAGGWSKVHGGGNVIYDSAEEFRSSSTSNGGGGGGGAWRPLPSMADRRVGCAAVSRDGDVYVMGGNDGSAALYSVERLMMEKTWGGLPSSMSMKSRRENCAAVFNKNEAAIFVVGDTNGESRLGTVEVWKGGLWTTLAAPMSTAREGPAAVIAGDKLYAIGGWDQDGRYLDSVDVYDLQQHEWTIVAPMTTPRRGCAAVTLGDDTHILVMGGSHWNRVENTTELYDIAANQWSTGPAMNEKREGCSAACLGDSIMVMGGYNGASFLASTEMLKLPPGLQSAHAPQTSSGQLTILVLAFIFGAVCLCCYLLNETGILSLVRRRRQQHTQFSAVQQLHEAKQSAVELSSLT